MFQIDASAFFVATIWYGNTNTIVISLSMIYSFLVGGEVQKSLVQEEGLMSSPNKRNHRKTAVYNLLFKSFLLILLRQLGPTTTLPSL